MMTRSLLIALCLLPLAVFATEAKDDGAAPEGKVWLYLQLNVEESDYVDSTWLYALVDSDDYEAIQAGDDKGYLVLRSVRYMDSQADKIMDYEDKQFKNTIVVRREFVALMYELKGDPLITYPPEEVKIDPVYEMTE